jgi:hypothetical protein
VKIAQLLVVVEKLSFFESAILNFYFQKKKKYQGWDEILMITLISSKKLVGDRNKNNTVICHNKTLCLVFGMKIFRSVVTD